MTITVGSEVWTAYYDCADFFIDDTHIGNNFTINYPPKRIACDNCVINPIGGGSTNVYHHGGPAPFSYGPCPLCGGNGYKEEVTTATVRLRMYTRQKDWVKIGGNINIPDADVQIIGYLSDMSKLQMADTLIYTDSGTGNTWTYQLAGELFTHGFGKNKYFVGYLKRV